MLKDQETGSLPRSGGGDSVGHHVVGGDALGCFVVGGLGNDEPSIHDAEQRLTSRRQRRLSATEVTQLVAGYRAGARIKVLAAQFGINRNTVTEHLSAVGVRKRLKGMSPRQIRRAKGLRANGWSYDRIGRELGFDGSTVWRTLTG